MALTMTTRPRPRVAHALQLLRAHGHLLVAFVALAVLYASVYAPFGPRLGLFADDFAELQTATTENFVQLIRSWPLDYRPLEILPWIAARHLADMHLAWYYTGFFLIEAIAGLLLYALLYRWTRAPLLALGVALLWATYPADEAVFWLTTVAYRTGALFLFLALLLLTPAGDRALPRWRYVAAIASALLCVYSNELYLGLLCALPVLAARRHAGASWPRRLGRACPFVAVLVTYTLYRMWFGPHVLHFYDNKGWAYEFSAAHMVNQWGDGWRAIAVITWQRVFVYPTGVTWAVGIVCAGAAGATALWLAYGRLRDGESGSGRIRALTPGLLAVGIGLVTIAAGYVPLLPIAIGIDVNGVDSRINAAATPGAASVLAGLLWIWCYALPAPRRWNRVLFIGVMTLLIAATAVHTVHLGNAMVGITNHHPCGNLRYHLHCPAK